MIKNMPKKYRKSVKTDVNNRFCLWDFAVKRYHASFIVKKRSHPPTPNKMNDRGLKDEAVWQHWLRETRVARPHIACVLISLFSKTIFRSWVAVFERVSLLINWLGRERGSAGV
jgi:hypothetical protein